MPGYKTQRYLRFLALEINESGYNAAAQTLKFDENFQQTGDSLQDSPKL